MKKTATKHRLHQEKTTAKTTNTVASSSLGSNPNDPLNGTSTSLGTEPEISLRELGVSPGRPMTARKLNKEEYSATMGLMRWTKRFIKKHRACEVNGGDKERAPLHAVGPTSSDITTSSSGSGFTSNSLATNSITITGAPLDTADELQELQMYIKKGADVCYEAPDAPSWELNGTVLHNLAKYGLLDFVMVCLGSRHPIDFIYRGPMRSPPIHFSVCEYHISDEMALEMFRMLIQRVESHPDDPIDWKQKVAECDFLSWAATYQRFSLFWPVVKNLQYFIALKSNGPISISSSVWQWDWEALTEAEQRYFVPPQHLILANKSTGHLVKLGQEMDWKLKPSVVQRLVKDGAVASFKSPYMTQSILQEFVFRSQIESVRALLSSAINLDFNAADEETGNTLLHSLGTEYSIRNETANEVLRLIVQRLEVHPMDKLHWGKKNKAGHDFLSVSADGDRLASFWNIVRRVPYFVYTKKPIPLTRPVSRKDWDELGEMHRFQFRMQAGFKRGDTPVLPQETGRFKSNRERKEGSVVSSRHSNRSIPSSHGSHGNHASESGPPTPPPVDDEILEKLANGDEEEEEGGGEENEENENHRDGEKMSNFLPEIIHTDGKSHRGGGRAQRGMNDHSNSDERDVYNSSTNSNSNRNSSRTRTVQMGSPKSHLEFNSSTSQPSHSRLSERLSGRFGSSRQGSMRFTRKYPVTQ